MKNTCSKCRKIFSSSRFKTCEGCRNKGEKYRSRNIKKIREDKKKKSRHSTIRKLKTYTISDSPEKSKLYNCMIESKINTAELAKEIGVNQRTAIRWLCEEFSTPNQDNKKKINTFFKEIIFK
jgi:predicted  nucleic acid-binding Zn-ribbon protein